MQVHDGKHEWKDEYEIDRILDSKGPVQYLILIKWKDYSDTARDPRSHLHPEAIRDFEMANDRYVSDCPFRCGICDLSFRTARVTKIHYTKAHGEKVKHQVF